MNRLFLIFVCVLTSACTLSLSERSGTAGFAAPKEETAQARALLLGDWYGEKTHDDGVLQRWHVKRAADGSYLIHFLITNPDGSNEEWAEAGIWGVRKPIYFTAVRAFVGPEGTQAADTTDYGLYDAYSIVNLTEDEFTYKSYTSGNEFTLKKVAETFRLTAAQNSSAKP